MGWKDDKSSSGIIFDLHNLKYKVKVEMEDIFHHTKMESFREFWFVWQKSNTSFASKCKIHLDFFSVMFQTHLKNAQQKAYLTQ